MQRRVCCYRWLVQARSPVRSTFELHRNKSLTVFFLWCGKVGGGGGCLGFQRMCDVSSGLSKPGGKSSYTNYEYTHKYTGEIRDFCHLFLQCIFINVGLFLKDIFYIDYSLGYHFLPLLLREKKMLDMLANSGACCHNRTWTSYYRLFS